MNVSKQIKQWRRNLHDRNVFNKFRMQGLTQQCMKCKHFTYRKEKPCNWVCRCPDSKMRWRGPICLGWEHGDHPEMVVIHSR